MEELGRIGQTPRGGLTRLALTDEDKRGRDWMVARMREAGLSVAVHQMGNIFGQRAGEAALPPVIMGAHVGSVPPGRRDDGQLGVLCGPEGIGAMAWSRLPIPGGQDHAGPPPMRIRHDALVAAAEVVAGVRRIASEIGGDLVTTVGNLVVTPNIVNAIPGRVTLSIDMRDP